MSTVFIPAKGQSSRIPRKNLTELGGYPLLWWTLKICQQWEVVEEIYVATEDPEIEYLALQHGANIYPLQQADVDDKRTVSYLWKEFCEHRQGCQILMHPTSPFRQIQELQSAWEQYQTGQYDVIISVREERRMIIGANNKPIISWEERMTRLTQTAQPFYIPDGSFYISDSSFVSRCSYFEEGRTLPFPLSTISCIEIDTPEDLELARIVANYKNSISR